MINNTSEEQTLTLVDGEARMKQQIEYKGYNICVLEGQERLLSKDQQGLGIFRI